MKVFRIAKRDFIGDLSGEAARLFGGRWNKKGTSLLYTVPSRMLAGVYRNWIVKDISSTF
ncbi:MAG: RES family NAD+ phosphorylase [Spirochaetota bacterium]